MEIQYICHRRGCGKRLRSYEAFETGWRRNGRGKLKYWCLDHIPWYTRLAMKIGGTD